MRDRLKVIRVDAAADLAQVVKLASLRDRAVPILIVEAMHQDYPRTCSDHAVTVGVLGKLQSQQALE